MPIRWLVDKTHELKEYDWGPMSMGRILYTLEASMGVISEHPENILDKKFMMKICKE
jgi:hypothetical protein